MKINYILVALTLFLCAVSEGDGDTKLPSLDAVVASMNQNNLQFSNYRFRSIVVSTASPGYWGVPRALSVPIAGREVKIQSDLGLVDEGNLFLDQKIVRVQPFGSKALESHNRYWKKKGETTSFISIDKDEIAGPGNQITLANGGKPTLYEKSQSFIPTASLTNMQITVDGKDGGGLVGNNVRVTGQENFRGLDCLRVEWSASQPGDYSGFMLICPERSYKRVYIEQTSDNPTATLGVKKTVDKIAVEKLLKVDNAWIPSQVFHSATDTYVDGHTESLTDKFRLVEFTPDVVTTDLLFEPQPSPGVRIFRNAFGDNGGEMEVAGGSILALQDELSQGDFSILKEEVTDLSKP